MSQNIPMSRDAALNLGLHKFISLFPCKHGHSGFRYTNTGACVECAKEAADRYRKNKHGPVIEIKVRVVRGDEDAVIETAKVLAAMRGIQL